MTRKIVLIGDLIASRKVQDRARLQRLLAKTLGALNRHKSDVIASPYTLTLGDEYQAVLNHADYLFEDIARVLAAIYPQQARISIAVGTIDTAINLRQAIGMDGPAFHLARDNLERLKKERGLFKISGVSSDCLELANLALQLVARDMRKWKHTRIQVFARLYEDLSATQIAEQLQLSEKTIYKSIDTGDLHTVQDTFTEIEKIINTDLDHK